MNIGHLGDCTLTIAFTCHLWWETHSVCNVLWDKVCASMCYNVAAIVHAPYAIWTFSMASAVSAMCSVLHAHLRAPSLASPWSWALTVQGSQATCLLVLHNIMHCLIQGKSHGGHRSVLEIGTVSAPRFLLPHISW